MKNWQFWTLLSVLLVILFICFDFLLSIEEDVSFIRSLVSDMNTDTYMIKDILDRVEYNTMPRY